MLVFTHLSLGAKEKHSNFLSREGRKDIINFEKLSRLIKNSGYDKPLLFEVMTLHSNEKDPVVFLQTLYKQACKIYDNIYS